MANELLGRARVFPVETIFFVLIIRSSFGKLLVPAWSARVPDSVSFLPSDQFVYFYSSHEKNMQAGEKISFSRGFIFFVLLVRFCNEVYISTEGKKSQNKKNSDIVFWFPSDLYRNYKNSQWLYVSTQSESQQERISYMYTGVRFFAVKSLAT